MILADRLRSRRAVMAAPRRMAHPPVTLSNPFLQIARVVWVVMAVAALVIWIVEAPLVYHAALRLHNTNGMYNLSPAEWRIGLHRLGLSPAVYAAHAVGLLFLMTGVMFLIGLLIFLRRSHEWMALLVSYAFVTVGAGIITAYAGGPALVQAHPELRLFLEGYMDLADVGWGTLFLIPLVFPDGRFVPRWTRWPAAIFFLPTILPSGTALDYTQWPVWLAYPLSVFWYGTVLLAPVYRYWRVSDAIQREQTKWVMFGLILALGSFLSLGAIHSALPWLTATPERAVLVALVSGTLVFLGFTCLPLTFAIAILRYHLWGIDLILNRALVYAGLTASVGGLYVLMVLGLGALFQAQGSSVLSLLATALVALLFHPLRVRLQHGVNRLLYGDRDRPYAIVSRLGRQLEGTMAPDAALPTIVQTVVQALKLPYAAITLRQEGAFVVAAAVGVPAAAPVRLPLVYQGDTVGELVGHLRCSPPLPQAALGSGRWVQAPDPPRRCRR